MALRFPLCFLLVLLFLSRVAHGGQVVSTLPGFSNSLPFTLETGYIGVADNTEVDSVNLFYYFVHSQRNLETDPIVLWISGGPGCSSLSVFFMGIGPLTFDWLNYDYKGDLPPLIINPYSWTKNMSVIFLDGPVGTGFSYATTAEGFISGDFLFANQIYSFLQQFLTAHPDFANREIYIAGDGYSGNPLPIAMKVILDGNAAGNLPVVNLKGYLFGNPGADFPTDFNARYTVSNRLALIPDGIYNEAERICNGNLISPPNEPCKILVDYMDELISNIDFIQALEPKCNNTANIPPADIMLRGSPAGGRSLQEKLSVDFPLKKWCRQNAEVVTGWWVTNEQVQEALHVEQGSVKDWLFCNRTVDKVSYIKDVSSVLNYHTALAGTNLRGLIYSGDHDIDISYIATEKWIWTLNLGLSEVWRAWSVEGETAGYVRQFTNSTSSFSLAYATVKGGGHYSPMYKPQECFELVGRFVDNEEI